MATISKEIEVTIGDPERQTHYKLKIDFEDYIRLQTDENFANSLLIHARHNAQHEHDGNTTIVECDQVHLESEISDSGEIETEPLKETQEGGDNAKTWGYSETINLINCMASHIEDFNHIKKRKSVYEHVANDMVSNGYNVSSEIIRNKWKSLCRSYTKAKDNKTRTGRGPSRFLFFDLMDDVLGNKPTNKCQHSINSSEVINLHDSVSTLESEISDNITEHNSLSQLNSGREIITNDENKENQVKNSRRLTDKRLKKEYIDLKKEEYKNRQSRHEEKLKLEKEKIEIEKKKIKLLEDILEQH